MEIIAAIFGLSLLVSLVLGISAHVRLDKLEDRMEMFINAMNDWFEAHNRDTFNDDEKL